MSFEACLKGQQFEDDVGKVLKGNNVEYEKQKRVEGFGKKWKVDYYLPQHQTILECKNITGKNLERYLRADCVKFLDIHNHSPDVVFILVFPQPRSAMGSFSRFCTKYNIKLATPSTVIEALRKQAEEANLSFGRSVAVEEEMWKAVESSGKEGIERKELARKLRVHYNSRVFSNQFLSKFDIVKSLTSPKRYFARKSYENSKEHELVEMLNKHHLHYSDRDLAERFGFSLEQVRELRKRLNKTKKTGWNFRKNRKNLSLVGFLGQ